MAETICSGEYVKSVQRYTLRTVSYTHLDVYKRQHFKISVMADVKVLIKKRGTIKASISRVNTFADNFDPDISNHHALKMKLRHLMELSAKYDDIQTQIEACLLYTSRCV